MTDSANTRSGTRSFLLRTLADPILIYVTIVMASIMYHYRAELTVAYTAATYVLGWAIFRVFDFINKHHFIGSFAYLLLFGCFMGGTYCSIILGYSDYPITFPLWFLTPQDSLEYNKWYTLAIFLLFLIFMLSVIYYFTRVRYRMFMNFLIFIIPFAIYGKEFEEMPIGFIIALAVGYVLTLALFNQLSDSVDAKIIDKGTAWRSAAVFTVLFALASALIPKPKIEADRTALDTMINADAFTDRLVEMLNVFRDTSSGDQFRTPGTNTIYYFGAADEPLQLKTATFTKYDFSRDSWSASWLDMDSDEIPSDEAPIFVDDNGLAADAIYLAAGLDDDLAKKYGLELYAGEEFDHPGYRALSLFAVYENTSRIPVPSGMYQLFESSYEKPLKLLRSDVIAAPKAELVHNETFRFRYFPESYLADRKYQAAVGIFSQCGDYSRLLADAANSLREYADSGDCRFSDLPYIEDNIDILEANLVSYDDAVINLMDYGNSRKIRELAEEITAGCTTDYEKAKALEWYFINNDYIYDLTYKKKKGDNAETFLFKSKTGVCYEYATAMTLMARSVGIPARYCEGFQMQEEYKGDPNWKGYAVTAKDAHGFPELYIRGYGWRTFEPTMSNNPITGKERQASALLVKAGIIILVISALVLLFMLIAPNLSHRLFITMSRRKKPNAAVKAVMHRMRRLYGLGTADTAHQLESAVKERSGADISETTLLFERSEYAGEALTDADRDKAIEQYISAYTALQDARKQERKNKKKSRRKAKESDANE